MDPPSSADFASAGSSSSGLAIQIGATGGGSSVRSSCGTPVGSASSSGARFMHSPYAQQVIPARFETAPSSDPSSLGMGPVAVGAGPTVTVGVLPRAAAAATSSLPRSPMLSGAGMPTVTVGHPVMSSPSGSFRGSSAAGGPPTPVLAGQHQPYATTPTQSFRSSTPVGAQASSYAPAGFVVPRSSPGLPGADRSPQSLPEQLPFVQRSPQPPIDSKQQSHIQQQNPTSSSNGADDEDDSVTSSSATSTSTGRASGSGRNDRRGHRQLCPDDETCTNINDLTHQRRFLHTCRLFPCYHGHIRRHAKCFRHREGQLVLTEAAASSEVQGVRSKEKLKALASVNFVGITRDAPGSTPLNIACRDVMYEIYGEWHKVKVHTLKRYLCQVLGVQPSLQELSLLNGTVLDDDLEYVSECGVGQSGGTIRVDVAETVNMDVDQGVVLGAASSLAQQQQHLVPVSVTAVGAPSTTSGAARKHTGPGVPVTEL